MTETQTLLNDDNIRGMIVDFCRDLTNHDAIRAAAEGRAGTARLFERDRWHLIKKLQGDIYITRVYECVSHAPGPGRRGRVRHAFITIVVKTDVTDTIIIDITSRKPELHYAIDA